MRRLIVFLAITAAHFALTWFLSDVGGAAIMAEFDGHGSHGASTADGLRCLFSTSRCSMCPCQRESVPWASMRCLSSTACCGERQALRSGRG
jgi:hypothetical protein